MEPSVVDNVERIIAELDEVTRLAQSSRLGGQEDGYSNHALNLRFSVLLPKSSSAYRILSSRAHLLPDYPGDDVNELLRFCAKWRAIGLAVLNDIDPDGTLRRRNRSIPLVTTVRPNVGSAMVERALDEAQMLLDSFGAERCIDRIHTALHGYFRSVATEAGIVLPENSSITETFKLFREQHPKLTVSEPRKDELERILRACATILDSLNPVRNMASLAHANENLLQTAEAHLIINVTRSLLGYFDAKLSMPIEAEDPSEK